MSLWKVREVPDSRSRRLLLLRPRSCLLRSGLIHRQAGTLVSMRNWSRLKNTDCIVLIPLIVLVGLGICDSWGLSCISIGLLLCGFLLLVLFRFRTYVSATSVISS